MAVKAEWTGSYPCLCSGKWKLYIDEIDYTNSIPIDKQGEPMYTYGSYAEWHFEDWLEVFDYYVDGLTFEDWIKENSWVLDLPAAPQDVYEAFQVCDWRYGSCRGCI